MSGGEIPSAYANLVYSLNPAYLGGIGSSKKTSEASSMSSPPTSERPAVGEANADISGPTMVTHRAHVEFDRVTGNFRGLSGAFGEVDSGSGIGAGAGGGAPESPSPSVPTITPPSTSTASSFLSSFFSVRRVGNSASASASATSSSTVSSPFNVAHSIHVAIDAAAPSGLRGLPREWEEMLTAGGISKAEAAAHPREILDVIHFTLSGGPLPPPKRMAPPLRTQNSLNRVTVETLKANMCTDVDPHSVYETEGGIKLGEGASGIVKLGVERATGRRVAIKVAPSSDLANLKNETALLALSQHQDIVSLVGTYLWEEKLWIVLEFIHGGSLTEVLGPSIDFPERMIAYVVKRLLSALAFLHGEMRLHRDIKSDNILVDFNGAVKVADFGFATFKKINQLFRFTLEIK